VSPAHTTDSGFHSNRLFSSGSFTAPRFLLLALFLNLAAIALDQFAAPILYSSSPLWAAAVCLALVWRRGKIPGDVKDLPFESSIPIKRLLAFLAAHAALILAARSISNSLQTVSGRVTPGGTLVAVGKLCTMVPTLLLFALPVWKKIVRVYFPEVIAGLLVLLTFFPSRALDTIWPWYGQLLGRCVYILARIFVPVLAYMGDSNPTLSGPSLDVTIVPECSGISGLELFDYLFGAVMILDWNRLRKGRALIGYAVGLMAILLGNGIRIISLVVFGNRGFAENVARFHVSAGPIFFSIVFLIYLSMTYGWMLGKKGTAAQHQPVA
jgi:exosortase/archaeosortase family protein